jgi:ferredoxin-NADP reductase
VTLRLAPDAWRPHLAGQHYDVRLTAPDGYTAQRSYSAASPPAQEGELELTIDRLPDGEVSPYLCDEVRPGDELELRGPIGGWFAWRGEAPALLVGGGSGVVPLMAMLRERNATAPASPMRLVASFRSPADMPYRGEIERRADLTFSRSWHDGWAGATGRVSRELLARAADPLGIAFVCGSDGFVEHVAGLLLALGYPEDAVRTERFGPTG